MTILNTRIKTVLRPYYPDYTGFADLQPYQVELEKWGGPIVRDYRCGISLGLDIADSIADFLPQRADNNVACAYRVQGYEVLNDRLNQMASLVSTFLNRAGYRALPLPAAERTDRENAIPTVSHKMIARIAGLGWIGKNCLLVTPGHGPRLRLVSILTDAPLETLNAPLEQRCGECSECVKICPVGALKGRNYVEGEARELRFDFLKCQDYFEQLKATRAFPVCGLCLHVCPHGKHKKG